MAKENKKELPERLTIAEYRKLDQCIIYRISDKPTSGLAGGSPVDHLDYLYSEIGRWKQRLKDEQKERYGITNVVRIVSANQTVFLLDDKTVEDDVGPGQKWICKIMKNPDGKQTDVYIPNTIVEEHQEFFKEMQKFFDAYSKQITQAVLNVQSYVDVTRLQNVQVSNLDGAFFAKVQNPVVASYQKNAMGFYELNKDLYQEMMEKFKEFKEGAPAMERISFADYQNVREDVLQKKRQAELESLLSCNKKKSRKGPSPS